MFISCRGTLQQLSQSPGSPTANRSQDCSMRQMNELKREQNQALVLGVITIFTERST